MNTDALRRLAHDVEHGWDTETGPSLRAAADEVDRLRTIEAVDVTVLLEQRNAERRLVADLRAVIENAPHADTCPARFPMHFHAPWPCSCWKADVL